MPGPMPRRRLFQPVPVERWAALQAFLVWALGGHRRWLESLKNERKNENPHILLQIPNIFPFTGDFSISEDSTIWVQLLRGLVDRSEDDVPALPALPRAPRAPTRSHVAEAYWSLDLPVERLSANRLGQLVLATRTGGATGRAAEPSKNPPCVRRG